MIQIEVARGLGRLLIDRTGNGTPDRMRSLTNRLRLTRPAARVMVVGRHFMSWTASGSLTAELHEAPPSGPTLGTIRCRVTMHGPEPEMGTTLSIASEWLGITDTTWPDDAEAIAERLARLGRLLVHGDEVVGATQVGVDQAVSITNDLDLLASRVSLITLALRTTVMAQHNRLRIVLASAITPTSIIYDEMDHRLTAALEGLVVLLPRSVIVDLSNGVLYADPVCLGLNGTSDIMEALRNVSTLQKRFGELAEKIVLQ